MLNNKIKIGFFGTPEYAVIVLNKLIDSNFEISFIVTMPDRPKGRKMIMTPPPAKIFALENSIPIYQPEKLKEENFLSDIKKHQCDVFVVIAYGKIIPSEILNIPLHKCINIHGSLLPKLRGASPIETSILNDDRDAGVTLIEMDSEMDHGPIIANRKVIVPEWPPKSEILGNAIVNAGADLLIEILPKWISGEIVPENQNHSEATFTRKINKEDGLLDLNENPYLNFLKIQAYSKWPRAFFFKNDKRIIITEAHMDGENLVIDKIIPEGKKEMNFSEFKQS